MCWLRGSSGGAADCLRFVLSTASYLPDHTRRELTRLLGKPVVEFYGLCEAGMMTGPVLSRKTQARARSAVSLPASLRSVTTTASCG